MSDFLLDFRPANQRQPALATDRLKSLETAQVSCFEESSFSLAAAFHGDAALWSPYRAPDGTSVVLCGRAAFDEAEWEGAASVPGEGGLAPKVLYQRYQRSGAAGLEGTNGNCVVLLYDPARRVLHLVTDCSGVFPAFVCETAAGSVYGSHPDVLAAVAGESSRLDELSLAEFIFASTLTPPFTYYQNIRFLDHATRFTFELRAASPPRPTRHAYFDFTYRGESPSPRSNGCGEMELAGELAAAFRRSVRRRTLPRLGTTAIALSGGLDSRALLACVEHRDSTFAFCCYNDPTREFRTAEAIARAVDVRFVPLQREFEYYGQNAEAGVRLSGGMGTFANNHFLGAMPRLQTEGMQNLLTGCYCDYLFKGLPLNRRRHRVSGREDLAPFRHEFYFEHHLPGAPLPAGLQERWESRVPAEYQRQDSPASVFQVEARRTFPLCYEGDNQQRIVPQRVTGWCLPVADREVLELYCRIPWQYKLNRSLFLKTVRALCNDRLTGIPDANTGARLDASPLGAWLAANTQRLRRKLRRARRSIATEESWPNWNYYVAHSRTLAELWARPNPETFDFFRRIIGPQNVSSDVRFYHGDKLFLFVSLLTLKLWFEARIR